MHMDVIIFGISGNSNSATAYPTNLYSIYIIHTHKRRFPTTILNSIQTRYTLNPCEDHLSVKRPATPATLSLRLKRNPLNQNRMRPTQKRAPRQTRLQRWLATTAVGGQPRPVRTHRTHALPEFGWRKEVCGPKT